MNDGEQGGAEYVGDEEIDLEPAYVMAGSMGNEPRLMSKALSSPDAEAWGAALKYKISQLEKLGTWKIIDKPTNKPIIPNSIVLKEKTNADGEIMTRCVRIVAGGHRQMYSVDYTETFSSAAKMLSVRVILALAAQLDWEIHQVDVKSAYLNATLKEEVYMHPPNQVLKLGQEGKVCRLLKAMYGLKQAGHKWYETLAAVFRELGYSRLSVDHSVFYKQDAWDSMIVAVTTDDMAIAGSSTPAVQSFKRGLGWHFQLADMGELKWFLGFEIRRDRKVRTIAINQKAYIEAMAVKSAVDKAKPTYLPAQPGQILSHDQSPVTPNQINEMANVPYSEAIGHVLWPAMVSCPDTIFQVMQLVQNPGRIHWDALKKVISYLNTTCHYWLTLASGEKSDLIVYTDANWASQSDHHSISGYAMQMGAGTVTWSSKKQLIVALSSTKSEYITQTHTLKEILWVWQLLGKLQRKFTSLTTLLSDNQGAIALAKNKFHARSKHIDIHYHFIWEAVVNHNVNITYVPTADNIADIFTKALSAPKFNHFCNMLGLRPDWGGVLKYQSLHRFSIYFVSFSGYLKFGQYYHTIFCCTVSSSTKLRQSFSISLKAIPTILS
jgi:hypothetical protein